MITVHCDNGKNIIKKHNIDLISKITNVTKYQNKVSPTVRDRPSQGSLQYLLEALSQNIILSQCPFSRHSTIQTYK